MPNQRADEDLTAEQIKTMGAISDAIQQGVYVVALYGMQELLDEWNQRVTKESGVACICKSRFANTITHPNPDCPIHAPRPTPESAPEPTEDELEDAYDRIAELIPTDLSDEEAEFIESDLAAMKARAEAQQPTAPDADEIVLPLPDTTPEEWKAAHDAYEEWCDNSPPISLAEYKKSVREDDLHAVHCYYENVVMPRLRALLAEKAAMQNKIDNLILQAQVWASECDTHKATIRDCYAAVGVTGKCDFNGAEPIREYVAAANQGSSERDRGKLEEIAADMKGRADNLYCRVIHRALHVDETKGEAIKMETGKFGPSELKAHKESAELVGAYNAFIESAKLIRSVLADSEGKVGR